MNEQDHKTVVLIANTSWYLWNFRRRLARELTRLGYRLVFVAPQDDYSEKLGEIGSYVPITLSRKGKNPVTELLAIRRISKVIACARPDVVLSWTPKLNVYCGLISRWQRFPLIPNVAGLGAVFTTGSTLARMVGVLYRLAFSRLSIVFFQNNDDKEIFVETGWLEAGVPRVLPGSGVDLDQFRSSTQPINEPFQFLYGGRLLAEKGLFELAAACRQLHSEGHSFVLHVYGHFDPGSASGISRVQMDAWENDGVLVYHGVSDCMEEVIQQSDCVVLPSFYREGVPRILLEAAACGRPIVTTDNVGCRDAVEDGVSGILCAPRDSLSLALAMKRVMALSRQEREEMGHAARRLAETRFDERVVIAAYVEAIRQSLAQ